MSTKKKYQTSQNKLQERLTELDSQRITEEIEEEQIVEEVTVTEEKPYPTYIKTERNVLLRKAPYLSDKVVAGNMVKGKLYAVTGTTQYATIPVYKVEGGLYVIDNADVIKM